QLAGKILVLGLTMVAVMPVMEFRRGKYPPQRPEVDADIGMDQKRLPVIQHDVHADGDLGKAKRKDREQRRSFGYNLVHRMDACRGEPIELFDAVVDGVELPQPRNGMECAVSAVKPNIAEDDHLHDLQPVRLSGNFRLKGRGYEPPCSDNDPDDQYCQT